MSGLRGYRIERVTRADGLVSECVGQGPGGPARLRVFEVPSGMGFRPDLAVEAWRFLDGAALQRGAGEAGEHWVRVLDLGREGGRVFVATEPVEETMQGLVDRRAHLRADDLESIVRGVVRGLREYHERWERPVGSLGLRTVTLGAPANPRSGVRLTDPLSMGRDRARIESVDAPALGRLIFRIVEGHDERFPVHPPIRFGPAWAYLGRSGGAWLEFTNRLLDPRALARGELPGFEEIEGAIPREPFNWRKPVGGAAAVLALGAVSGLLWWKLYYDPRLTDEQVRPMRLGLERLCVEYPGWVRGVSEELIEDEDGELRGYESVPGLSGAVGELREGVIAPIRNAEAVRAAGDGSIFDPRTYWKDQDGGVSRLTFEELLGVIESTSNEELRTRYGQRTEFVQVQRASETLTSVRETLTRDWSLLAALRDRADEFRARGWDSAGAEILSGLVFDASLHAGGPEGEGAPAPTGEAVMRVLELASSAQRLESRWVEIDGIDASEGTEAFPIGASGAALSAFDDAVSELLSGAEGVTGALEVLERARPVIDEMIWAGGEGLASVAWESLERDGGRDRRSWIGADPDEFAGWVADARAYRLLETDPRPLEAWDGLIGAIREDLEGLIRYDARDLAEPLERRLFDRLDEITTLRETPVVEKYRGDLVARSAGITSELQTLAEEADSTYVMVALPIRDYLADVRSVRWELPEARAMWERRINAAGPVEELEGDEDRDIGFRRVMNPLRATLEWMQSDGFEVAAAPGEAGGVPGFDRAAFEAAGAAQVREAQVRMIQELERLIGEGVRPSREVPAVAEAEGRVQGDLDAWSAEAVRVATVYGEIARALDEGALLDEGGEAGSIVERELDAQASPVFDDLRPAVVGIRDRIGEVRRFESLGTASELEGELGGVDLVRAPELLTASWRLLSDPDGVRIDSAPAGLRVARSLVEAAALWAADAGTLSSDPRREFERRVESEGATVWGRLASAAATGEEIRELARARGAFGVDDGALPEPVRWNVRLADLGAELEAMADPTDEEASKRIVRGFLTGHDALGVRVAGGATDPAGLETFLEITRSVTSDDQEQVDYEAIGPMRLNDPESGRQVFVFREDLSELPGVGEGAPNRLVYEYKPQSRRTDDSPFMLEFLLANPGDPSPVLLGRSEISLLTVISVLQADGRVEGLAARFDAPSSGPLVWSYTGGQVTVALEWLRKAIATRVDYEPGTEPEDPRLDHPVQRVGPETALYIAGLLGCRLPTPEEYRSAVLRTHGTTDEARLLSDLRTGRLAANVRDETWETQRAWAERSQRENAALVRFTPEVGAFEEEADRNSSFGIDDGVLWFRRVHAGERGEGGFEHLIGNVSEWVCTDPEPWQRDPGDPVPYPDFGMLQSVHNSGTIWVAGASSLSAPSLGLARVHEVTRQNLGEHPIGFADVGFRLALVPKGRFVPISEYVLGFVDGAFVLGEGG
ncbi:MAG: hypothetical protein ACF8Q5_01170 [Phycisphaerales bacterium JB040]